MFTLWIIADAIPDLTGVSQWTTTGAVGVLIGLYIWDRTQYEPKREAARQAATDRAAELCAAQQEKMFVAMRQEMAAERAAHKETQATLVVNREAIVTMTVTIQNLIAAIDKRDLRSRHKEQGDA